MNPDNLNQKWRLAYVRKSPLPPYKTWTEAPFYTYLVEQGTKRFYKAMRKDRPVDIEAITSYPVLPSFIDTNTYIDSDETVFIDWKGNYFIAPENCIDLDLICKKIIGYTKDDYSTIESINNNVSLKQELINYAG